MQHPPETATVADDLASFLAFWDARMGPGAGHRDIQERRAANEAVTDAVCMPPPRDVSADTQHWIDTADGPVRLRIFRHESDGLQPGMIFFPGGAFVMGSPEAQRDIAAFIASHCRMSVLSVDYAKA
ncbi:MAG: alpha/beta hydrolase fold domain-containing protein, partial [Qingshengfaniella sp.]